MASAVYGFQNQFWVIEGYDSLTLLTREVISFSAATEEEIMHKIEEKAKMHLTASEVNEKPQFWRARKDESTGKRITYTSGLNPFYLASLWRSDELESRGSDAPQS